MTIVPKINSTWTDKLLRNTEFTQIQDNPKFKIQVHKLSQIFFKKYFLKLEANNTVLVFFNMGRI